MTEPPKVYTDEENVALLGRIEEALVAMLCWMQASPDGRLSKEECRELIDILVPRPPHAITAKELIAIGKQPSVRAAVSKDGGGRG